MKTNFNTIALSLIAFSLAITSCSSDDQDAPATADDLSFYLSARLNDLTPSRSGETVEKTVIPSTDNENFSLEITATPSANTVSRSTCYTSVSDAKLFCTLWHKNTGWSSNLNTNLVYDYNAKFNGAIDPAVITVSGEGQHKGLGIGFNISVFGYTPQSTTNAEPMGMAEKTYPYVTYMLPQNASEHEDFALGFYTIVENQVGHHVMDFYHALSAVLVKIDKNAYIPEKTGYVAALRITNLYIGGKCEMEYELTSNGYPRTNGIKWSNLRRQPGLAIAADFSREEGLVTEDGVTLKLGETIEQAGLFNSTFMMIPQTTPAGADLCVIYNQEREGGGEVNQQIHFNMGGITFKPGNVYTLTVMANR